MTRMLWLLSMALAAVVAGTASAIYATQTLRPTGMLTIGVWEAVRAVGDASADPYAHAFLASSGQLPPGSAEGMRFVALGSQTNQLLVPNCAVELTGRVDVARLWTLTVTQANGAPLAERDARQTAVHSRDLVYQADGSFSLSIGPQPTAPNALLVRSGLPVAVVIHVYDGAITSLPDSGEAALPLVTVGTDGAGCPA